LKGEQTLRPTLPISSRKLGLICTSIAGKTSQSMRKKANEAFALGTDIVEFRFDLMTRPSADALKELRHFARKAIFTVRSKEEGGGFKGGEDERLELISELARAKPLYLDIELNTARENASWCRGLPEASRRIVSWHDFTGTPSLSAMRRARAQGRRLGDVVKIVTTAEQVGDNQRVMKLYDDDPGELIAFCMGEVGTQSRLESLQRGSPVTYAALPSESVAPGQLPVTIMVSLKRFWERV
jgi:3-dehydroquinate dehydratase-1